MEFCFAYFLLILVFTNIGIVSSEPLHGYEVNDKSAYPFQAHMIVKAELYKSRVTTDDDKNKFVQVAGFLQNHITTCGATIIDEKYLITAAHCLVVFEEDIFLLAKEVDIELGKIRKSDADIYVKARGYKYHPSYIPTKYYNDIAIVEMDQRLVFNFGGTTYPINLPTSERDLEGKIAQTTGFGFFNEYRQGFGTLRHAFQRVLNISECKIKFPYKKYIIRSTHICTESNNPQYKNNVCDGDSGGPLFYPSELPNPDGSHNFTLIGVTSLRSALCGSVSVFTKVSSFVPYIRHVMANGMLHFSYYVKYFKSFKLPVT